MTDLKLIPIEAVLERMENDKPFKLVEVLSRDQYEECHLPGAINLPLSELDELAPQELDREDDIVVYCASYSCHASTKAARRLTEMGYAHVTDFKGGKAEWRKAGLDLEEGPTPEAREAPGRAA